LLCSETVHNTATATGDGGVDAGKKSKGRKPFLVVHSQGHWLSVRVLSARCHNGTAALKWWPQELKKTPLLTGLKRMYGDRHLGGTFKEGVEADTTLKVIAPQEQIGVTKDGMKWHKKRRVVERTYAWERCSQRPTRDFKRKPRQAEAFCCISSISRILRNRN
jgi:putative transposase